MEQQMITVKEEFLTDDKTKRAIKAAGYEVLAMWLAMKRYAAEHLSEGFVPNEDIYDLPGAPKNSKKALEALVGCGHIKSDGTRGAGLVEQVQHGWMLHDYLEHANSREQEERRRAKAKERKERWQERSSERRSGSVPAQNGNGVPNGPPTQPNPTQEEDLPTPLRPESRRNSAEALFGNPPGTRPDVIRLHEAWKKTFGLLSHRLKTHTLDAQVLADSLDEHGEENCMLVLANAPNDGMVSGREDDRKQRHESIHYIFGNPQTFARILRDALRARKPEAGSVAEQLAALKERQA